VIDYGAELDSDIEVGPYAVIGERVRIGSGSCIGPHVVIRGPTSIGSGNRIFQFASVGEDPQDKKYGGEETFLTIGDDNMKIGIVASEPSGDLLGAALVRELKAQVPGARFVGVAGPQMQAAGCDTLVPMERLSVMGLTEVLRHLRELLRIRGDLIRYFLDWRPDVFIGVDAPDFNLGLERRLRETGIRTAHLVSPTIWAWRAGRVKTIRRSLDLMLSIFPFEEEFLRRHGVSARYVGHPLADEIAAQNDPVASRAQLGMPPGGPVLALLPGSRMSEVRLLSAPFLRTARWCLERYPGLHFTVPLVTQTLRAVFTEVLRREAPALPVTLVDGRSRDVIAAADCVLTASGTATLETLLINRPMVVGYRMSPVTYRLIRGLKLVKVPYIAMANLLAGRELAPEFIQGRCRADLMGPAVLALLQDPDLVREVRSAYQEIHGQLRRNAGRTAAAAVLELARGARC
jgi:lipid-A-disaccharide synthase